MDRTKQMKWLLILTSVSLIPVYILIGWQSGGHGPNTVANWFWYAEAIAWGIRALVESMALIYLFSTYTNDRTAQKRLAIFETALIVLIGVTVTLLVISNGSQVAISKYGVFFYIWAGSVAAFAPLMLGSVGFAYKVHKPISEPIPVVDDTIKEDISHLQAQLSEILSRLDNAPSPVIVRRQKVLEAMHNEIKPTQKALAEMLGVSVQTIQGDLKALNGSVK